MPGIEPGTSHMRSARSTTELHPPAASPSPGIDLHSFRLALGKFVQQPFWSIPVSASVQHVCPLPEPASSCFRGAWTPRSQQPGRRRTSQPLSTAPASPERGKGTRPRSPPPGRTCKPPELASSAQARERPRSGWLLSAVRDSGSSRGPSPADAPPASPRARETRT